MKILNLKKALNRMVGINLLFVFIYQLKQVVIEFNIEIFIQLFVGCLC